MGKAKRGDSDNLIKTGFLILITFAVLLGVVAFISDDNLLTKDSLQNNSRYKSEANPTESYQFPLDTENDGVYINYKFRYKFEYPADVFDSHIEKVGDDLDPYNLDGWYNSSLSEGSKGDKFLSLSTDVVTKDEKLGFPQYGSYYTYDEVIEIDPGSKFLGENGIKLRNLKKHRVDGVILYYTTPPNRKGPREYRYAVEFAKDNFVYRVSLRASDYQLLSENKLMFDKVVDSIEFMNN
ncbi:MAG: hypothetical protein A2W35_02645 [Chloroflexi bacterium RBG_16_57_11]|nr:MAG: hypothetical protein A2W35_02645 [Chloroflexi bacterium RBG_16_57_11]